PDGSRRRTSCHREAAQQSSGLHQMSGEAAHETTHLPNGIIRPACKLCNPQPEHLHYVKVTAAEPDEDGWRDEPEVKFECRGNASSKCRNYPGCECEYWSDDHEHPSSPQDECW